MYDLRSQRTLLVLQTHVEPMEHVKLYQLDTSVNVMPDTKEDTVKQVHKIVKKFVKVAP